MAPRPLTYKWNWHLESSPEALWYHLSNTNRLNHDLGLPALSHPLDPDLQHNGRIHFQARVFRILVEWVEEPFQWRHPYGFEVKRYFTSGPVKQIDIYFSIQGDQQNQSQLEITTVIYPKNIFAKGLVKALFPLATKKKMDKTVRRYNKRALENSYLTDSLNKTRLKSVADLRARKKGKDLKQKYPGYSDIIDRLTELIRKAHDIELQNIRPYKLADEWNFSRKKVLEACLYATRIGLLHFQWDLLCPHCRNATNRAEHMSEIEEELHCDICNIDYELNFDKSVELTFYPSPEIRRIKREQFCRGGPGVMPHIVAQQLIEPGGSRTIDLELDPGSYWLRTRNQTGNQPLWVGEKNNGNFDFLKLNLNKQNWATDAQPLLPNSQVELYNDTEEEQLAIIERTSWNEQAVTGARVASLQVFRDLFSGEALKPGKRIVVGNVTIMFTDLIDSTKLYRDIGDAPAFGYVIDHFDILKECIDEYNGSMLKTLGDSVMAVFVNPYNALSAITEAQRRIAGHPEFEPPLRIKAGIHTGNCIAVNLDERLDYFGSTVNIASRIVSLAQGHEIVFTETVRKDPEVSEFLNLLESENQIKPLQAHLKGFEKGEFNLYRLSQYEN